MYTLIRNVQKVTKAPAQCVCYSALRQPNPHDSENSPNKTEEKPIKSAKSEQTENERSVKVEQLPSAPKDYDPTNVTKQDMKWRTPWHQREGQRYSTLRTFYTEDNNVNLLKLLQTPINLSPSAIQKWWREKQQQKEIAMQGYLPERHQTLGNELAAAHFIVHRGGAVKFYHENKWIKANQQKEYSLPRFYEEDKILQAIDCSDMNLYYEGLSNLRDLKQVEWLSFNGVENLDDWFLDKISNLFSHSLVYLDIRNCPKYTERGLGALHRIESLKILCIDDMLMTTSFEMTCLMLQEVNPNLDIQVGEQ